LDKISRSLIISFAVLLALAALAACGSAEETLVPSGTVPGISVSITGSTCPSVEIRVNEQVTWINEDEVELSIRVNYSDGEKMVEFGELQPGDSASLPFQAGSFPYLLSARHPTDCHRQP
jgi:hypothetical protein